MAAVGLPIATSITTSSSDRLVLDFLSGNKQAGTVTTAAGSVVSSFTGLQFGGGTGGTVAGGMGIAGAAGATTLGWSAATGEVGTSIAELAYAFDAPGTVIPKLSLQVDRTTGEMTLTRAGFTISNVVGYSITSAAGALNQAAWKTISDNYDGAGAVGGGEWTELTQAGSVTDLSEFTFDEGDLDGGQIAAGSILLGDDGAWLRSPIQDLQMTVKLGNGISMTVPVEYTGPVILRSDFDLDGDIDAVDFAVIINNYGTAVSPTLLDAQSYEFGDVDGNQAVNNTDWRLFKQDYIAYVAGSSAAVGELSLEIPSRRRCCCLAWRFAAWD